MNKAEQALRELHEMDVLAAGDSPLHSLCPLAKFFSTILYIAAVVSFGKYELAGLAPLLLWPVLLFQIGGIPIGKCFYKLRFVLPLVLAVGLFNPLFDRAPYLTLGGVAVSGGVYVEKNTLHEACVRAQRVREAK
jgi:cobalt/nickel transport system permease protein